jgi:hypothetical protein
MRLNIKFSFILILLLLLHFSCYSQLLKDDAIIFRNFKVFEKVGNSLNLIKSAEANTKITVSTQEIYTYIKFESTLIGAGEQIYLISNISKKNESNKLICNIDCFNLADREKKNMKFIFEYNYNQLTKIYIPLDTGIMEFY